MLEKRALQVAVALGCLVPIGGGARGIWLGPQRAGAAGPADLDSHFRYLSGLLLGIGLAYLTAIPRIEQYSLRFRILTAIVVVGGLGRLASLVAMGTPSLIMTAALAMELIVTPALALWQHRIARLSIALRP